MMKFLEFFRFEVNYQSGRYITWVFFVVVLAFAVLSAHSMVDNVQKGEYFMNSPVIIAVLTAVSSMFCLILTAAVAGNAAVRDIQTRMESLIYTTSLGKLNYLGGRFMAAFFINLLVLVVIKVLILIASVVPGFGDLFMPFRAVPYITSFLLFALPNAFVTTALLFSLAMLSRKAMSSFLGAGLLFFLALVSMDIISSELGLWELGKRLDPSGMTVLRELRMIQTPLEIPTEFVRLDASLLFNRLLWVGIAGIFLALAYLRFRFVHHPSGGTRRAAKRKLVVTGVESRDWSIPVAVPAVMRAFDFSAKVQQAVFLCFQFLRDMLRGKLWLIVVVTILILVLASEEILEGQLGVPLLPNTWSVLQLLNIMAVGIVVSLLITFYAGELVWKERDARLSEMTDAAPVPDWVLFLAKFTGLFFILLFVQALFMVAGIIIQLMHGYYEIDLWLYLRVLFGFRLIDYLLFAVVALSVQVLVNQKYVGYLVVFIAWYYMKLPGELGLQHNLLIFGSNPAWSYSEISGFEPFLAPWLWFKLYWIGWAFMLALLTNLFWSRGKEQKFSRRLKGASSQMSGATAKLGLTTVILIFLVGGFLFYNTNILNKYISGDESTERRALYEKSYARYHRIPQPLLTGITLQAEIYPENREAEVYGRYQLANKTAIAIDTIHLSTTSGVETSEVVFSRKAAGVLIDDELGHSIYKLEKPLQPGDSLTMSFKVHFRQKGFSNSGIERAVVGNGTYIGYHNMPAIGYQAKREINDKKKRKEYGLDPQPAVRSVYDKEVRMDLAGEEKITFEAVIGTTADQMAVTAGSLQSTWRKNGRHYFRYVTDAPIRHNYEIFSAKYEVHKAQWKDVEIQIFHHPGHTKNLERMVKGLRSSLEYFTENFSSYPHRQIRMVEYPGSGVGLNGNPVTMSYSEGFSFYAPEKDDRELDFPFAVVAHEVAHQWWGNELRPAYVEGAPVLTETLAWYSAMMVVEKTYGPEHLDRLLRVMRREYLTPRSAADVPLLKTTDRFNAYRKGPFAMYALKEYVGEKQLNTALKRLLVKFGSGDPPLPVSLDLYAELQAVTPDSLQYLLKDLFERNTFWELKAENASGELTQEGKWAISFKVSARKIAVDTAGIETEIPMNDLIEIGIYEASEHGEKGELLYLEMHRILSGEQTISVKLPEEPFLVQLNPRHLLFDRKTDDNYVKVTKEIQGPEL